MDCIGLHSFHCITAQYCIGWPCTALDCIGLDLNTQLWGRKVTSKTLPNVFGAAMAPHGTPPKGGTQKVLKNKPKMALLAFGAAAARVLCVLDPKSIKKQTILRGRGRAGSPELVAPPASCHWKCPARSTGKLPQINGPGTENFDF